MSAVDVLLYVHDAVTAFKNSNTAQGTSSSFNTLGSDARYIQKYKDTVRDVVRRLDQLVQKKSIVFAATPDGSLAHYDSSRDRIEINADKIGPGSVEGQSPLTEANLARLSLSIAHEGVHACLKLKTSLVEEEMTCRIVQVLYAEDLVKGITIDSKAFGKQVKVSIAGMDPTVAERRRQFLNMSLIDDILRNPTYNFNFSAELAERMIIYNLWGGISKRTPVSKGYILRKLAEKANRPSMDWILVLLESVKRESDWKLMMQYAMDSQSRAENLKALFRNFDHPAYIHLNKRFKAISSKSWKPWP